VSLINDERKTIYTITWSELRKAWEQLFIDKTHKLELNWRHGTIMEFRGDADKRDKWRGFTIAEANDWCQNGYMPGLKSLQVEAPMQREKRRVRCAEEGEYQHDAALSGFDYPFLSWDRRLGKRGVRVLYDVSIAWTTPAEAVKKYLAWIAEFSHSMEYADLDYSLGFVFGLDNLMGHKYHRNDTHIIVKNEDEAASFQNWSSMLSPAAYRGFCFFAAILHAEKAGKVCSEHIGTCRGTSNFQVDIENDTETIMVWKPVSFYKHQVKPDDLTEKCKNLLENPFDKEEVYY